MITRPKTVHSDPSFLAPAHFAVLFCVVPVCLRDQQDSRDERLPLPRSGYKTHRGVPLFSLFCRLLFSSLILGEGMSWAALQRGARDEELKPPTGSSLSKLEGRPQPQANLQTLEPHSAAWLQPSETS